jgi:hypothetical protein
MSVECSRFVRLMLFIFMVLVCPSVVRGRIIITYLRKIMIRLLDMQLRWHAGRAVDIVVMMGWHDLQCTWPDARMSQPYCTRQA